MRIEPNEDVPRGRVVLAIPGECASSWIIHDGPYFRLGVIRCSPEHPRWRRVNDIPGYPVLLMPSVPLRITPCGGTGGVLEAGSVLFLDSDARYRRECLVEGGDRSNWFAVRPDMLYRVVPELAPDRPGGRTTARFPVAPREYALQRAAFRHVLVHPVPDTLLLEEAVCTFLDELRVTQGRPAARPARASHRDLAEAVSALLALRFSEPLGLLDLAAMFDVAPAHLCRVYRSVRSRTIHAHRDELRLAAALDRLEAGENDLTALALDLGYSSHAHFTANFTRAIGCPPSAMRQDFARATIRRRRGLDRADRTPDRRAAM